MTESGHVAEPKPIRYLRKRRCCVLTVAALLILVILFVILAFTVFKAKDPRTQVLNASVEGVAPRVSFPVVQIELNITLDLEILVYNPNEASFKHGVGKSLVFYRGIQVGEVEVSPGYIPKKGSETLNCSLTLEADKFATDMKLLISDVLAGVMEIQTKTRIPGKVKIWIFRKHAVALSNCHMVIGLNNATVLSQECDNKTKF